MRAPQLAWFYSAAWPEITPPLTAEARADLSDLHSRAGQWFIENGSPMDAVRHAFLARRPDWAAELIEGYCLYDYLSHGRFETFSRWMQQLPREAREERPLLLFLQIWRSINLRRFPQAEQTLRTIETAAADPGNRMSNIARSTGLDIAGRLHLMRALIGAYGGDLATGLDHIRQLEGRELDQLAFGQVDLDSIHSYLAFHTGDLELAERLTWRANGIYDGMACHWGGIHSRCIAAMSYLARGWIGEAEHVIRDTLQVADRNFEQHSYMVALPSALLGIIAYNQGDFVQAERLWLLAIPSEKATDVSGLCERVLIATVGLARLYDMSGRSDEATALLVRASRRAYESEDFRLEFQLAVERADRFFRQGNAAEGRREWERLLLQLPEARRRYPTSAWQIWDPFAVVESRFLSEIGQKEAAVEGLKLVAQAARQQGRVSSERQIGRFIEQLEKAGPSDAGSEHPELKHLLDYYLSPLPGSMAQTVHNANIVRNAGPGMLTQREEDVLELLKWGLSNGDIARRLNINLNTVKTHTKNIFSKLGVKSRTQAVLKTMPND